MDSRDGWKRGQSQEDGLGGYRRHSDEKTSVRQRKKQEKTNGIDPECLAKDLALNWIRGHKEILFSVLKMGIWENSEVVSRS